MDNQELANRTSNLGGNTDSSSGLKLGSTESKKKLNVPAIILGITTLLCAGAAVFFGINYLSSDKGGNEQSGGGSGNAEQGGEGTMVSASNIAQDYNEVKQMMEGIVDEIDGAWGTVGNSYGLVYKPDGMNTFIPMKLDLNVEIRSNNSGDASESVIKSKLEKIGFSAIGQLPVMGSTGPIIQGYLNSEKNIVCGLYSEGTYQNPNDPNDGYDSAYLECAKTDWIWLTDEEKQLASALEKAYHDKTGEYPSVLYGLDAEVEDSTVEPYQTIDVAIGGGYAKFYRVSPEAEWQYFTGGQTLQDCSAYDTDDLKKAFSGEACYAEDMTESKVQP